MKKAPVTFSKSPNLREKITGAFILYLCTFFVHCFFNVPFSFHVAANRHDYPARLQNPNNRLRD